MKLNPTTLTRLPCDAKESFAQMTRNTTSLHHYLSSGSVRNKHLHHAQPKVLKASELIAAHGIEMYPTTTSGVISVENAFTTT